MVEASIINKSFRWRLVFLLKIIPLPNCKGITTWIENSLGCDSEGLLYLALSGSTSEPRMKNVFTAKKIHNVVRIGEEIKEEDREERRK